MGVQSIYGVIELTPIGRDQLYVHAPDAPSPPGACWVVNGSPLRYRVDWFGVPVDYFRTRSAAEHGAERLNTGAATVSWHAVVGCRIVAR